MSTLIHSRGLTFIEARVDCNMFRSWRALKTSLLNTVHNCRNFQLASESGGSGRRGGQVSALAAQDMCAAATVFVGENEGAGILQPFSPMVNHRRMEIDRVSL